MTDNKSHTQKTFGAESPSNTEIEDAEDLEPQRSQEVQRLRDRAANSEFSSGSVQC